MGDLSWFRTAGHVAGTLLAAAAGGGALAAFGFPAGWLSGAILVVAGMSVAGVPARVPPILVQISFVVIGISMGAAITPDTLHLMAGWPASLAMLALSIPAVTAASAFFLVRVAGFDRATAVYAAVPGALSYVMAAALASTAIVRHVAFVQTLRLCLLAVGLPGALAAAGQLGPPPVAVPVGSAGEIVVLISACGACAIAFDRLRVPGGLVVGAMLASTVLHGLGLLTASVPGVALVPCFVLLGGMIGTRFAGTDVATMRRLSGAAIAAFVVAAAVATLFALAAALVTDVAPGQLIVAFAPGGFEAMVILGFALGFDPAFVTAHHLVRFVGLALVLPLVAPLVRRSGKSS